MKTLYIVRHAKAEETSPLIRDFDRKLVGKGLTQAKDVGKLLFKKITQAPSLWYSSTASRAITTAQIMADMMHVSGDNIHRKPMIYGAGVKQLVDLVVEQDDLYDSMIIFGHNPTFSQLVNQLSVNQIDGLHKCGVVGIQFDTTKWSDCATLKGHTILHLSPKISF